MYGFHPIEFGASVRQCDIQTQQTVLSADGVRDIRLVLEVMAESDSHRLKFNEQLRLQSGCQPLLDTQLAVVQRPLQPPEAAVLAYCWNWKFFHQDCQQHVFSILYNTVHPGQPVPEGLHSNTAVQKLLQAIGGSHWKPGLLLPQALSECFPGQHSVKTFGSICEHCIVLLYNFYCFMTAL